MSLIDDTHPIKMLDQFLGYLRVERGLSHNTIVSYRSDLNQFLSFISMKGIDRIEGVLRTHISDFIKERSKQGFSAKTMHRSLSAIRRFFWFLRKEGMISVCPASDIDLPRVEKRLPKYACVLEIDALLDKPAQDNVRGLRDAAMIAVLYASGLRVSELVNLKMDDVDLMRGYLRTVGKGQKERLVPLNEKAQSLIAHYLQLSRPKLLGENESDRLFIRRDGFAISRQSVWKIIKKYGQLCGLSEDFSPHKIRHSFATHLLEGGVSLRALQLMLGHSDLATTEIYMHVNKSHLKALYDKYHPRSHVKFAPNDKDLKNHVGTKKHKANDPA